MCRQSPEYEGGVTVLVCPDQQHLRDDDLLGSGRAGLGIGGSKSEGLVL